MMTIKRLKPIVFLMLSVLLVLSGLVFHPTLARAAGAITLDSPANGTDVPIGTVRISGTYSHAYDVKLFINGERQVDAAMIDPDGDDSGTWNYDLDTRNYSGAVRVNARALDVDTRYGVWSPTITLALDNPDAESPQVAIVNPVEGISVQGIVPIEISVSARNQVQSVMVRINSGAWQTATYNGTYYSYGWNTVGMGNRTNSIEAKATDIKGVTGFSLTTYAQVGLGTHERVTVKNQDRSMWIWEPETYKLLLNPGSRTVLDKFAKDTATFGSDPITTLYLAVGSFAGIDILEDDPGKLRDFIVWAHAQGYQVQACISGGTSPPYMGAYAAYHNKAVREMERIINYNIASALGERFDGVNVDIEPYIAPDFKTNYPSLQLQYLDGLKKMIVRRDAAGIDLSFGPAVPKWYDSSDQTKDITWNGSTKWLSEHIQDISDYISIMDYRDTADGTAGIIAGAQGEIDYANSIGKPNSVVIGVETLDIANSGDPESITFQEEGRIYLEAELDKVYSTFNGIASFGGIAMHHYDSLRTLPSYWGEGSVSWKPPVDTEPPTAVSVNPRATTADYQSINLSFGMAYDNMDIDRYIIYRSETSGFTPGPKDVAGTARSQSFSDIGLLPNKTYYYKVAAKDIQGNIGPASSETSAKTGLTSLKPMVLTDMSLTAGVTNTVVQFKVIDKETKQPIAGAAVEGRFHFSGGKYTIGTTDASGRVSMTSETIPTGYQVGFEPRRINLSGYYWAQAYDLPHLTTLYPRVGLSGLSVNQGTLNPSFATNTTNYTVVVPSQQSSITITPTALTSKSVIYVGGQLVSSGTASQVVPVSEGNNTISIVVIGSSGETDVYTVKVIRTIPVENVILVSEDTYVYQNAASTNYGNADLLEIIDIPSASGGGDRLSYMKVGFTNFNEPVESAKLNFYVPTAPIAPLQLTIYGYGNDNWSEGMMNYTNRLGAGSVAIGTIKVTTKGWYSMDVSSFVQSQMATDKTATFSIMDPNTKNILVRINSKENTENRPYMVINPSSNARLSSLSLSKGSLSPTFSETDTQYSAYAALGENSLTIIPVASERHATVTINGRKSGSGQVSEAIPLEEKVDTPITITVTAQNGNIQNYTITVKHDLAMPVTTDNAPAGWVSQDTTVSFNAIDSGSGVAATYYTLDGGAQQSGNSVSLATEGSHILVYWSVDKAGNVETAHSATVNIDKTAPVTTAVTASSKPDGSNGWYVHPVTVSLSVYESLSGVSDTEYSLDDGSTWQSYSGAVSLNQDGQYTFSYRSKDQAGNIEAAKGLSLNLDTTAPTTSVTDIVYDTYVDIGDLLPVITLNDNLSGVDNGKVKATLDTIPYKIGDTIPLYTLPLGSHSLVVDATDMAGNSAVTTATFQTYATFDGLKSLVTLFEYKHWIDNAGIAKSLQKKLVKGDLGEFMQEVRAQNGKHIMNDAANYLLRDARAVIDSLKTKVNLYASTKAISLSDVVRELLEALNEGALGQFVEKIQEEKGKRINVEASQSLLQGLEDLIHAPDHETGNNQDQQEGKQDNRQQRKEK